MPKYSEHREKIQSGDILAWSHEGWGSWHSFKIQMVRIFTRSEFSHVAVAWRCGGRLFVIEAVEPMVRIYPLSKLESFYHLQMDISGKWNDEVEEAVLSYVGDEYKQLEAILAFFKPLKKGSTSECAALVQTIMALMNIDVGTRSTPDAVVKAALNNVDCPIYYIEKD